METVHPPPDPKTDPASLKTITNIIDGITGVLSQVPDERKDVGCLYMALSYFICATVFDPTGAEPPKELNLRDFLNYLQDFINENNALVGYPLGHEIHLNLEFERGIRLVYDKREDGDVS